MRAFIAITVPDQIKQEALRIKEQLTKYRPDIKWVEYENYHITLKFLGEVNAQVEALKDKLAQAAQACPPFRLENSEIGFFPNRNRPRVIWMGVRGEMGKAHFLGEKVDTSLSELGFEPERKRSFHLTLGRIRSDKGIDNVLAETVMISKNLNKYSFTVNDFSLMESRLSSTGPEYLVLEKYKLLQD
jgi:2'-5' RNA ligase